MEFFIFLSQNDFSCNNLKDNSGDIHYQVGEEIVFDVNDDNDTFWEQGIHCIMMEAESTIEGNFITYGTKVAIIEANEEDIVYKEKGGTCRLKRCKVIDIFPTKELLVKLEGKSISTFFFLSVLRFIPKIEYNKKHLELLLDNFNDDEDYFFGVNFDIVDGYFSKLDKYYPEIEEYLCKEDLYDYALIYTINQKKYTNPLIKEYVSNMQETLGLKGAWESMFGE